MLALGDRIDPAAAFDGFAPKRDAVRMPEVEEDATQFRCHTLRIDRFFAALRHARDELRDRGADFASVLAKDVRKLRPQGLVLPRPVDFSA